MKYPSNNPMDKKQWENHAKTMGQPSEIHKENPGTPRTLQRKRCGSPQTPSFSKRPCLGKNATSSNERMSVELVFRALDRVTLGFSRLYGARTRIFPFMNPPGNRPKRQKPNVTLAVTRDIRDKFIEVPTAQYGCLLFMGPNMAVFVL